MKRKSLTQAAFVAFAVVATTAGAATQTPNANNGTPKTARASEVIGAAVFDQSGEKIGDINDIVFDENTGAATHAVLAIGGFLGIGENVTAVPWKHVGQSEKATPGFVVDVDKAKLAEGENYDRKSWPDLNQAWFERTSTYYGLTGKTGKKLVRGSQIIGSKLFNQEGEDIGSISDLLMNPNSGKVGFAVAEVRDFARENGRLPTVPSKFIRQSKEETAGYVMNVDQAKLQNAAYFNASKWPDYNDKSWSDKVSDYWGVTRDWWKDEVS